MMNRDTIGQIAREYIERLVLCSEPLNPKWNRENYIFRKPARWNYMDSCMMRALLMYAERDPKHLDYAVRFTDSYVTADGRIPTMRAEDFNLDNICGGLNLIKLHRLTGSERYKLAYERLYSEQLARQPRLACRCYWHKAIYPHQLWLDGVYMALPFLAEYGKIKGDNAIVADALSQIKAIRDIMRDPKTGLYYHGFDETRSTIWADRLTGLSREFWLRSNGWLCAGLAELYEITRDGFCGEMLAELLDSLRECLTDENMLLQLPARKELGGNYPETSGTLLYAYAAMKAHRLGIGGENDRISGESSLNAVTENYISHDENGLPILRNICLMGGLGGENNRDGSAEYYLSERIVENEAKGIAPFLMAVFELTENKKAL